MAKVHWIPPDGDAEVTEAAAAPTLDELQRYVGGWIEIVRVLYDGRFPVQMIVNEEGRLRGLPVNEAATQIYWAASAARGVDLADPEQRRADSRAYWRSRGVDPDAVIDVDPRPDLPPYIHGPAVLLDGVDLD